MSSDEVIKWVFKKGYRIDADGQLLSPKGIVRKPSVQHGYNKAAVRINGKVYKFGYHRLAAFQKYGEIIFSADCVRHLDGNSLNNKLENIEIGTYKENKNDMPKDINKKLAEYATSFVRKWNKEEIKRYHNTNHCTYAQTMQHFGISSKGTLWFILKK